MFIKRKRVCLILKTETVHVKFESFIIIDITPDSIRDHRRRMVLGFTTEPIISDVIVFVTRAT
jgi:hypothetical protein